VAERFDGPVEADEEDEGWPIGFMIVVGLAALYVGWRLIQMIAAAIEWMF
jgi:hypothetical protein